MSPEAVYPMEAIEAHRAFSLADRQPDPETNTGHPPRTSGTNSKTTSTSEVSVGSCGRAFGTPCFHEHACVRCSLLRPDPAQRPRLEEIRSNLEDRIEEAKLHGWLGEVEGLQVSLAGVKDKLAQIDTSDRLAVDLGTPSLPTNAWPR